MKRPFRIILLILIALLAVSNSGLRLVQAIIFWKVLKEYNANVYYIAISGGIWLLISLLILIGIWLRMRWAWAGTIGGAAGYVIWYWCDRLVIQTPHASLPFALVVTVGLACLFTIMLFNPKTHLYFKE